MIRTLAGRLARRRILVAGEMLELGEHGHALHAACGRAAAEAGLDLVVVCMAMRNTSPRPPAPAESHPCFFLTPQPPAAGCSITSNPETLCSSRVRAAFTSSAPSRRSSKWPSLPRRIELRQ